MKQPRVRIEYLAAVLAVGWIAYSVLAYSPNVELDYSDFKALIRAHDVQSVIVSDKAVSGKAWLARTTVELPPTVRKAVEQHTRGETIGFTTQPACTQR
jgi:hypothetical protein